jgi:hypothetical protein
VKDLQQQHRNIEEVALRIINVLLCRALGSWVLYFAEQRRLTMALTKALLFMLNNKIACL